MNTNFRLAVLRLIRRTAIVGCPEIASFNVLDKHSVESLNKYRGGEVVNDNVLNGNISKKPSFQKGSLLVKTNAFSMLRMFEKSHKRKIAHISRSMYKNNPPLFKNIVKI